MLKAQNITYSYFENKTEKVILRDVNLDFSPGKLYTLFGDSGSGKTTFLSLLGGLDQPQSGGFYLNNQLLSNKDLSYFRKKHVGFVFQDFNLIQYMNGVENVMTALEIATGKSNYGECIDILESVGISKAIAERNVRTLSGGEKQRVAIARALAGNKQYILADEPTGNLDGNTSLEIMALLQDLAKNHDKCVVVVTHSKDLGAFADVILHLDRENHQFVEVETAYDTL